MIEVVCNDRLGKKVFVLLMTQIKWATLQVILNMGGKVQEHAC